MESVLYSVEMEGVLYCYLVRSVGCILYSNLELVGMEGVLYCYLVLSENVLYCYMLLSGGCTVL